MARLLVVEDDDDIRDLLAELLTSLGHDVSSAQDGEAGLERLGQTMPEVILLDVEMPRLDGPGMVSRMLEHGDGWERIPVVLLSGAADLVATARHVGTPYFVEKPANIERVNGAVERALRDRCPPQPARRA